MVQLYNNPPNETANDHATMQFGINGGSHNRVNTISAVAESAGNRKMAFTFCTDEAGSRTEKMRITGDGKIGIGTASPSRLIHAFEPTENNLLFLESGDTNTDIIQSDTGGSTRIRNSQGSFVIYVDGDAKSSSAANSVTGLTIDGDQDVHIYDDLFIPDKIIHEGDTDTALRFPSADTITAEVGGSEKFRITTDGIVVTGVTTSSNYDLSAISVTSGLESPYDQAGTGETVFVYDTSKDSDGGAWRKRTSHTSWYNEGSGTYRGSRKEFPALSVVTMDQGEVTIYDADGEDLTMWMQFRVGNPYTMGPNGDWPSCTAAYNGILVVGDQANYGGVTVVDFVKDEIFRIRGSHSTNGTHGFWPTGIHGRNGQPGEGDSLWMASGRGYDNDDVALLVSDDVWSVDIKPLKNAPIDPITKLPIPTIAVGCDTGITILRPRMDLPPGKDAPGNNRLWMAQDVTVSNASYTLGRKVRFMEDDSLLCVLGDGNGDYDQVYVFNNVPPSDNVINVTTLTGSAGNARSMRRGYYNGTVTAQSGWLCQGSRAWKGQYTHQHKVSHVEPMRDNEYAAGTRGGLTFVEDHVNAQDDATARHGMVAYATTSFATGWLPCDPKVCLMADTNTNNITGTELLTGWTNGTTHAYDTLNTSGRTISSAINSSGYAGACSNAITMVEGEHYVAQWKTTFTSGNIDYCFFSDSASGGGSLSLNNGGKANNWNNPNSNGYHNFTFVCPSSGTYYLCLQANGAANYSTDAVSV